MFNATDFWYDGIYSGHYGLRIATIDGSVVENTSYINPTRTLTKSAKGIKFRYGGSVYEQAPTTSFSVLSQTPINDLFLREILCWLDNRKGFRPLQIIQAGLENYVYNCIFDVADIIYHAGCCVGLTLTATFDSPYTYKATVKSDKDGRLTYEEAYKEYEVESADGAPTELYIDISSEPNGADTDAVDDYVYPMLNVEPSGYFSVDGTSEKHVIKIVNETDDANRAFVIKELSTLTNLVVDNELKMIKPKDGTVRVLESFEGKKWLRLVKGTNKLKVQVKGVAKILVPQRAKIRF